MAAKSNRRQAYEEKRFPPPAIQLLAAFKNKRKKDVYKYISSFREKYRYVVIRYLGCILSGH